MADKLGITLVRKGLLTQAQLDQGLGVQLVHGGRLGTRLVELGFLDIETVGMVLGELTRMPVAMEADFDAVTDATLKLLTPDQAEKHQAFPLAVEGRRLKVALANPLELQTTDALGFITGMRIVPYVTPELRLFQYQARHYGIARPTKPLPALAPVPIRRSVTVATAPLPPMPPPPVRPEPQVSAMFGGLAPGQFLSDDSDAEDAAPGAPEPVVASEEELPQIVMGEAMPAPSVGEAARPGGIPVLAPARAPVAAQPPGLVARQGGIPVLAGPGAAPPGPGGAPVRATPPPGVPASPPPGMVGRGGPGPAVPGARPPSAVGIPSVPGARPPSAVGIPAVPGARPPSAVGIPAVGRAPPPGVRAAPPGGPVGPGPATPRPPGPGGAPMPPGMVRAGPPPGAMPPGMAPRPAPGTPPPVMAGQVPPAGRRPSSATGIPVAGPPGAVPPTAAQGRPVGAPPPGAPPRQGRPSGTMPAVAGGPMTGAPVLAAQPRPGSPGPVAGSSPGGPSNDVAPAGMNAVVSPQAAALGDANAIKVSSPGGSPDAAAHDGVRAHAGVAQGGAPDAIAHGAANALVDTAWGDLAIATEHVDMDVTDTLSVAAPGGEPPTAAQGVSGTVPPAGSLRVEPPTADSDASLPFSMGAAVDGNSGTAPGAVAPMQAIASSAQPELVLDAELVDDDDNILIPESFDAEPEAPPVQVAAPNAQEPKRPEALVEEALANDDILEEAEVMSAEPHKAQADAEPSWDVFTDESSPSTSARSDTAEVSPSTPAAILTEAPGSTQLTPPPAFEVASHEDGLLDVMEFEDLPDASTSAPPAPAVVEAATPPEAPVLTASQASSEQEQVAPLEPQSAEDVLVSAHSDAPAPVEVVAPRSDVQASPVENATVPQDSETDALEFSLAGESTAAVTPPVAPAPESSEPWQVAAAPKPLSEPAVPQSPETGLTAAPPPDAAPSVDASRTGIPPEFEVALIPEGAFPQEPQSAEAPEPASIAATPEPAPESPAATGPHSEAVSYLQVEEDVPAVTASAPDATEARAQAEAPAAPPEDTTPPKPRLVVSPAPAPARERTPISLDDLPASSEEPMQLASTWEFVGWQGGGEGEGTVGHTAETTWADRGVDLEGPATSTPASNEGGVALASAWEFMQQPWQPQATLPLDTAQGLLAAASASTDTPLNGPSVTADQVLTALDTADSQGTVGKVLLAYSAGRFRRAFLLGDSFGLARVGRAWGPGSERPEVSALKVDLDSPSLLASALKGPSPSVFSAPQGPQDEAIFSALCESESHLLVFPLHARGQPVAFFVAEHGPAPVELSTLEELARIADRAVEICTRLHRFP
ncbi:hypothetical protein [Corallococcus sicarius]|uniref:Type II secretion system protein GspE N-terminal domain-containing protein n=1 Tax=Corallococcus sicarius TaxID=2316726 RepID=A0A3A8NK84_9BACT|nr:hypothetical protein [Corallococcus sicarius]RKH41605.1 hypothetical protein D7X12_17840 [Corallococcus sicarius]